MQGCPDSFLQNDDIPVIDTSEYQIVKKEDFISTHNKKIEEGKKIMWVPNYMAHPNSIGKGKIIPKVEHLPNCPARNMPSTGLDPDNHTLCDIEDLYNHIELNISMKKADIYMTAELGGKYHKVRMPIWFCPFCGVRIRYDGELKADVRPSHYVDGKLTVENNDKKL